MATIRSFLPVPAMLLLAAAAAPVSAASPQYCAFYAREYVKQFEFGSHEAATEIEVGDGAYYRCLNQDAAPVLPSSSAYAGSDLDGVDLAEPVVAEGDADPDAAGASTVAEVEPPARQVAAQRSRSGLRPWSDEWRAWCERHFPNSFDPETGEVLPYSGARRFC